MCPASRWGLREAHKEYLSCGNLGARYGVVISTHHPAEGGRPFVEEWNVLWFNASEVPIEGRSLFTGGGRVTFELSRGRSEPFSKEQADKLLNSP